MSAVVAQQQFHPMLGHVADGTVILLDSGKRVTLKNTMRGWVLKDEAGAQVFGPVTSANEVAAGVLQS